MSDTRYIESLISNLETQIIDLKDKVRHLEKITGDHEYEITELKEESTINTVMTDKLQEKISDIENDLSDIILIKS